MAAVWSPRAVRVAAVFAAFGFISHFVPSEPFLTQYLIDVKGFTEAEVNNQIYPVWTYSYLAFLSVVGPLTEAIGYKRAILLNALAVLATRTILIYGTTLASMKAMQVTYGLSTATDVAFYTYIYRLIEEEAYQRVTSTTRAAVLTGHVLAGLIASGLPRFAGQTLVSFAGTALVVLFYISFGSICVATVIALFIPPATAEIHRLAQLVTEPDPDASTKGLTAWARSWVRSTRRAAADVIAAYHRPSVLSWSLWWMLAMCGIVAVEGYASSVWYALGDVPYYGYVDAAARLAAAGGALLPMLLAPTSELTSAGAVAVVHRVITSAGSIGCVFLCIAMATTVHVEVAYAVYIAFEGLMYGMIALAAAQLATRMSDEHFAAVFGVNTFCALALNSLLQIIITALNLDIQSRFMVYTIIFALMAFVAVADLIYRACTVHRGRVDPDAAEATAEPTTPLLPASDGHAYNAININGTL